VKPSASPLPEPDTPDRNFNMLAGCRSVFEYEQLNKIDEGTYGVVFRARDKKTMIVHALKKVKAGGVVENKHSTDLNILLLSGALVCAFAVKGLISMNLPGSYQGVH